MNEQTHFERVIGGTETEKEKALEELQQLFEHEDERVAEYEAEKTEKDKEVIEVTISVVDELVAQYGGDPKPLPLENIYVLKPDAVKTISGGMLAGAFHSPLGLKIGVEQKPDSSLGFASGVAHELFHLKSYKSARIGESGEGVRLYRSGISMIDSKDPTERSGEEKEYFAQLEEALVVECTRKSHETIKAHPLFREEAEAIDQIVRLVADQWRRSGVPEEKVVLAQREIKYIPRARERAEQVLSSSDDEGRRAAYAVGMFGRLLKENEIEFWERYEERKKLNELLDRIVERSGDKFASRDEVFDEFAKANFSGNYLPLARMVEGVLGKGAFRQLAEEFSAEPKREKRERASD